MKKLIVSLLSLSVIGYACDAQAQIAAGTKLLGGSIAYTHDTYSTDDPNFSPSRKAAENKVWGLNLNPRVAVFLADNLAVGITTGFGTSKAKSPYYDVASFDMFTQVGKQKSVHARPFLRYYYLPTEAFGFYGQLSAGYSRQWGETEYGGAYRYKTTNSGHSLFANITPALVFFPIAKLGLELTMGSIGYDRTTSRSNNTPGNQLDRKDSRSTFGANFRFDNLALGASYYIGR